MGLPTSLLKMGRRRKKAQGAAGRAERWQVLLCSSGCLPFCPISSWGGNGGVTWECSQRGMRAPPAATSFFHCVPLASSKHWVLPPLQPQFTRKGFGVWEWMPGKAGQSLWPLLPPSTPTVWFGHRNVLRAHHQPSLGWLPSVSLLRSRHPVSPSAGPGLSRGRFLSSEEQDV